MHPQVPAPVTASTKASHAETSGCFRLLSSVPSPLAEQCRTFRSSSPLPPLRSPLGPGNFLANASTAHGKGRDASISKAHFRGPQTGPVPSTTGSSLFGTPITPLYGAAGVTAPLNTACLLTNVEIIGIPKCSLAFEGTGASQKCCIEQVKRW
jgi:hypothetical protein